MKPPNVGKLSKILKKEIILSNELILDQILKKKNKKKRP